MEPTAAIKLIVHSLTRGSGRVSLAHIAPSSNTVEATEPVDASLVASVESFGAACALVAAVLGKVARSPQGRCIISHAHRHASAAILVGDDDGPQSLQGAIHVALAGSRSSVPYIKPLWQNGSAIEDTFPVDERLDSKRAAIKIRPDGSRFVDCCHYYARTGSCARDDCVFPHITEAEVRELCARHNLECPALTAKPARGRAKKKRWRARKGKGKGKGKGEAGGS